LFESYEINVLGVPKIQRRNTIYVKTGFVKIREYNVKRKKTRM